MNPADEIDIDAVLTGGSHVIGPEVWSALAAYPLECVETEYPHYQYSVESADSIPSPRERHPVFYGCFDWHSAVHSHWCLVRQLRLFENHPDSREIVESIEERFTAANIEAEVGHLEENPSFEKPYGWAWLLRLAAELSLWDAPQGNRWQEILAPLESTVVSLVETELLEQDRPFRVGTHQNTAFALAFVHDYATVTGNRELATATEETARDFFLEDRDYPVEYEPLGWDFISPALTEVDLMRRVLEPDELHDWVEGFFPNLTGAPYETLLEPIDVDPDPDEDIALHLVGMNIAKAWCLVGLADTLPAYRHSDRFEESAKRHAEAGLELAFTDDYAGSHWLSSFVLYLLTRNEGGIAEGSLPR